MTANRKAELQRKLALKPVPKPPAGLADRIKSDIPKPLMVNVDEERSRLRRAVAFDVRVAASILLLVSSLYFVLHLLSTTKQRPETTSAELREPPRPLVNGLTARTAPPRAAVPRPQALEDKKAAAAAPKPQPVQEEKETPATRRRQPPAPPTVAENIAAAPPAAGGVAVPPPAPEVVAPQVADAASKQQATATLPPAAPRVAAAPAPKPLAGVSASRATGMIAEAKAADLALAPGKTLFGVSLYAGKLDSLTRGETPSSLDAGAVVQHFAAPIARPRRDVRLETEIVEHPFEPGRAIVRVSLDAPEAGELAANASVPPAASDASLTVDFDAAPRETDTALRATSEPILLRGSTVTAIYDVPLNGGRIATIRFSDRSARDGRTRVTERTLRAGDARPWASASRRTKSAALAALWVEALRAKAPVEAIRAEAEKAGARELAALMDRPAERPLPR
jgi:hypothetical protein